MKNKYLHVNNILIIFVSYLNEKIMIKSNTLFQHPVYIGTNSIVELLAKYEDFDADSHSEDEVNQDIEVLEYLYHNLDDFIKKPSYEQLKKHMNNALEELADKVTNEMRGTDY